MHQGAAPPWEGWIPDPAWGRAFHLSLSYKQVVILSGTLLLQQGDANVESQKRLITEAAQRQAFVTKVHNHRCAFTEGLFLCCSLAF